jgi:hypothetical protein
MILNYILITLLLYILSIIVLKKSVINYLLFVYSLHIFLPIILFRTFPVFGYATGTYINMSVLLTYITYILINPSKINNKHNLIYLSSIIVFIIYVFIVTTLRGNELLGYLHFVRNFFFNLLLFSLYLMNNKKLNSQNTIKLVNIFFIIIVIQIFLGLFQYVSPSIAQLFIIDDYQRLGVIINRFDDGLIGQNLVVGSLFAMQNVSVFIMVGILFIYLLKIYKLISITTIHYLIIIAGIVVMIMVGVRAPFVGLFVGIMLIYLFNNKLKLLVIVSLLFVLIPITLEILQPYIQDALTGEARTDFEGKSWIRVIGVFAIFDSDYIETYSIVRSVNLYSLIITNPLFGSGPGIIFTNYSVTDAFLAVLLLEYGLIGVIILLFPYVYTIRLLDKKYQKNLYLIALIIFGVCISQTLTNEGIWAYFTNIQFFVILMILFEFAKLQFQEKLLLSSK